MKIIYRVNTGVFLLTILSILILSPMASMGAPSDNTPVMQGAPDLLMIVDARFPGQNKVSLTYPKIVNRTDAEAALGRLMTETRWVATNIVFTDESLEESGQFPMTSIEFSTPQAIRTDLGELPIEPIIKAYRNEKNIQVLFVAPKGFVFQGVENFENKYVGIQYRATPGEYPSYTYTITVKDPNFKDLNLPTRKTGEDAPDGENSNNLKIAFVVVLALLAATIGYIITSKISHRGRSNRY